MSIPDETPALVKVFLSKAKVDFLFNPLFFEKALCYFKNKLCANCEK